MTDPQHGGMDIPSEEDMERYSALTEKSTLKIFAKDGQKVIVVQDGTSKTYEDTVPTKKFIGSFLGGASVADHLGDIRDDEVYLWLALGVSTAEMRDASFEVDGHPRKLIIELTKRQPELAEFFPDHILKEDDE